MKIGSTFWLILICLAAFNLHFARYASAAEAVPAAADSDDAAQKLNWPRVLEEGGNTIKIYQPQIQKWVDNQIEAQAAVAVTRAGETKETFGVVWLTARTEVDKADRLVSFEDPIVSAAVFPQDHAHEKEYQAALQHRASEGLAAVPLDHLEASLVAAQAQQKSQTVPVKNDPPRVIVSKEMALLVLIDGEPVLRAVEDQKLLRVINTRAFILLDPSSGKYYLHAVSHWYVAESATGPWAVASAAVPMAANTIMNDLAKSKVIDTLDPANPDAAPKDMPAIYVSTTPAELIQLQGEPQYMPIQNTGLLYVANTDAAVFMLLSPQRYFVLISGRWFQADSLDGPWKFVAGKDLPPDFAMIPPDSPKANVLVSVPGTSEAKEAVIANSIPQTATVNIADAHLEVIYDGAPKFVPIDGAPGLDYAANTALPVIRIDNDNTYWCVQNGVWFRSAAPMGAWVVATSVPGIIYTIPVSCPIHYVTYVKIYGATPELVYVGYTPGYMGTCVSSDGVVVYGTGYYYPAYCQTVWVGYPPTYGYGASFACGVATGFAFGFAAGAIMGDCWCRPYWGPCYGYGHVDINTSSVYSNWRGGVTYTNRHYSYNGWTGESWSSGRSSTFNPYSGRSTVGGYSSYYNRQSGDFNAARGGATYNPNTGVVHAGGASVNGNVYNGTANVNRAGGTYNTNTNTGIGHYDNNVYASHDGNVYRYDPGTGWQQHTDDGWQNTLKSNNESFSSQQQNLDQQRTSRDLSQQRYENVSRPTGGAAAAGGYHGGGFSRRR